MKKKTLKKKTKTNNNMQEKIGVIGLGYVGLPLALSFSKYYPVIGFDISKRRVDQLKKNYDWANEHTEQELKESKIKYTTNPEDLNEATFFIITVPTPVTKNNIPDLEPVRSAAQIIGEHIQKGSVVVLESTVYPGVTEELVGGTIEKASGLKSGKDFTLGYSPERINPGDKDHTFEKIVKVVSGQNKETLERVAAVYSKPCKAGIFKAGSIQAAEAAKVIENTQRDINIALMNELSLIFHKMGINTKDVLDAANTKWNFLKFTPGLVGGHCIGVDPYYLTYRAQEFGHHAEVILAGRRINDHMATYVAEQVIKMLNKQGKPARNAHVLVLGLTFKENVKDCRNSKVLDIIRVLKEHGVNIYAYDPMLVEEPEMVKHEFDGLVMTSLDKIKNIDATVLAVSHKKFDGLVTSAQLKKWMPHKPIVFDVKNALNRAEIQKAGIEYDAL